METLSVSTEENKAVVRRFFAEVINVGNTDRADEFFTTDYVEHQQLPGAAGRHSGSCSAGLFSARPPLVPS